MLSERMEGEVAVLTLDYPARRNALAMPMREALIEALERIEADRAVRAVVLTGAGGHFSAGGDLSTMDVEGLAAGRERFRTTHRLVRLLIKGSKPVVAAVEGYAVGAGLSLALCCDTVIAGAGAVMGAGFGRMGLVADLGLLHTLPLRVGLGRARQMLIYGDRVGPEEALGIGLIDRAVEAGGALAAAIARAASVSGQAPLAVAMTKQFLCAGLDAALDWERDVQSSLFGTADHAEGKAAFFAKRSPVFAGR